MSELGREYDSGFFRYEGETARRSAQAAVPLMMQWLDPKRVVDVGCGVGAWLAVFRENGAREVLGVDGEWVDTAMLEIPESCFRRADLTQPLAISEHFDLAVSLEVAEHLPVRCADTLVDSLVRLAPVVLFSAAIPHQGGTHHVNEQWPEYWASRFHARGYVALDCLRSTLWNHPGIESYYAQNMLFYVEQRHLERTPQLRDLSEHAELPLALVHPRLYLAKIQWWDERLVNLQGFAQDLASVAEPGETLILVDDGHFGKLASAGYRTTSLDRDEEYWRAPPDDLTAIDEFERLRAAGARLLVIAWPAFWWLDHYREFTRYLRERCACLLENQRLIVFDLENPSR